MRASLVSASLVSASLVSASLVSASLAGALIAATLFADVAVAKVVRLEVTAKVPHGTFKAGDYVRWDLRVTGELSPAAERIADLDKASRNARGMVEYATRVSLVMPTDPVRGNGAMLVDVPNRGRAIALPLYNSPRDVVLPLGSFGQGTGFLQDRGYTVAVVAWELGFGVELPQFAGPDGQPRHVEGVALAIIRDVADFFANASADGAGVANPLSGAVSRTLAVGYSQTGRLLKSFLTEGYNAAEGRRVFAGMHILGAAAGQIALRSVPGPQSGAGVTPNFATPDIRGIAEEPLSIAERVEQVAGRGEIPPRIVFLNTTTDYFSLRASLSRTGGSDMRDRPLPANVRMYDIAGTAHSVARNATGCQLPPPVLDFAPIMRSSLIVLDRWVGENAPPPASELMPLQAAGENPHALRAPSHLPHATILVPVRDADGNPIGGVRLPDVAVPLGTHGGQNPPLTPPCNLAASYVAFAKTKEAREAAKDPRPSLAERYKGRDDYVNRIRAASRELEQRGLLLPEDAAVIMHAAAESPAFK